MIFVLLCVDIIFKVDFNIVVHLRINILAQETADDSDALQHVSFVRHRR